MVSSKHSSSHQDTQKRPSLTKRAAKRAAKAAAPPPTCQVDGCFVLLANAKNYHRSRKICEFHAKASTVLVAGLSQRFCHQCHRFQDVSEFDLDKRSCRMRLAGRNQNRRSNTLGLTNDERFNSPANNNFQNPDQGYVNYYDPSLLL